MDRAVGAKALIANWLVEKRLPVRLCQVVRRQLTPLFPNEGTTVFFASAVMSKRLRWLNNRDGIAQG